MRQLKGGMVRICILALLALTLAGCEQNVSSYRYRLTLVVDDNGHSRTGSSVVEVKDWTAESVDGGNLFHEESRGQATVVDMGEGKLLVALLSGSSLAPPLHVYDARWRGGPSAVIGEASKSGRMEKVSSGQRTSTVVDLIPEELPTFVTFSDWRDPKTAVVVDPRDLQANFGAGVSLKSATIEYSDAPITSGITKKFPWLRNHRLDAGNQIGGGNICGGGAPCLTYGQFAAGVD